MARRSHKERCMGMGQRVRDELQGVFDDEIGDALWVETDATVGASVCFIETPSGTFALFYEPDHPGFVFSLINPEGIFLDLRHLLQYNELKFLPNQPT